MSITTGGEWIVHFVGSSAVVPGFVKVCRAVQKVATKSDWPVDGKFNKITSGAKSATI